MLAALGLPVMPEAGRAIIRDQTEIGGTALHTGDTALFAELMLAWEIRSHRAAAELTGPVFFDRGIPDLIGYARLTGRPVPAHVWRAAEVFRYHPRVFVAPPWWDIYVHDDEREQGFDEAVRTFELITEAYRELGYEPVPLPEAGVPERVAFIRAELPGSP